MPLCRSSTYSFNARTVPLAPTLPGRKVLQVYLRRFRHLQVHLNRTKISSHINFLARIGIIKLNAEISISIPSYLYMPSRTCQRELVSTSCPKSICKYRLSSSMPLPLLTYRRSVHNCPYDENRVQVQCSKCREHLDDKRYTNVSRNEIGRVLVVLGEMIQPCNRTGQL